MKITSKLQLKALIKECLIEILTEEPLARSTPRSRPVEQQNRQHSMHIPEGIPSSMKSLFVDSQRRVADKLYQESVSTERQGQALESMAKTWEDMTFGGTPLPSRAANPADHGGIPAPAPPGVAVPFSSGPQDLDDGFDPYEAVKSAIPRRR